jgi:hypothetical protein
MSSRPKLKKHGNRSERSLPDITNQASFCIRLHIDCTALNILCNVVFCVSRTLYRMHHKYLHKACISLLPVSYQGSSAELPHNRWLHIPYQAKCSLSFLPLLALVYRTTHNDYKPRHIEDTLQYNPGIHDILSSFNTLVLIRPSELNKQKQDQYC